MAFSGPSITPTTAATAGKAYLLYVATAGTQSSPTYTLVGGQRGADLNRQADEIDASCKTDGGWKSVIPGLKSWNISLENLYVMNDAGAAFIEEAFLEGALIMVKFVYANNSYVTGICAVTECSLSTPHTDVATMNCTLSGMGGLTKTAAPSNGQ